MRKHIGNISRYRGRPAKDESAYTEEEKLRRDAIKKFRLDKMERQSRKHMDEILGERDISGMIVDLFDENGKAPPYISLDSIDRQYSRLSGQRKWLAVIHNEFHRQLAIIDPQRYEQDMQERKKAEEKLKAKRREAYDGYMGGKEDSYSEFTKAVHWTIGNDRPAWELRQKIQKSPDAMHIIGVRQLEAGFHHLFADSLRRPQGRPEYSPEERYNILMQESDWILVVLSDIDHMLYFLRELMASAREYADKVLNGR